jgi:fumarate reductase subunit D
MRLLYSIGMVVSTIATVFCGLLVALTLNVGRLPGEPEAAPQIKLILFGTIGGVFVALAILCGILVHRHKRGGGEGNAPDGS